MRTGRVRVVAALESLDGDTAVLADGARLQVDDVIAASEANVAAYHGGNEKLFGFFVGQAMKVSGGKANPKVVNEILRKKL